MGRYAELSGKRVVVTGAASGIGLAAAQRFAKEGAKVVIFDINDKALAEAMAENPSFAGGVKVDVADEGSVAKAFKEVDKLIGGIDVLVSNAGISVRNAFVDTPYSQWQRVMNINLGGMFLCAKEAISRMEKQKEGVVLFTASTNAENGYSYYADYNSSKAGVVTLVKTICQECSPWLRVNCVSPGYVMTPMQKAEYTEEMFAEVNAKIPMGRHAEPEEVAALYAFLASDDARYITGQNINLDGGGTVY